MCKPDGIRAIYQYVTFSKDSSISGFDLSVTATADQLESQVSFVGKSIYLELSLVLVLFCMLLKLNMYFESRKQMQYIQMHKS